MNLLYISSKKRWGGVSSWMLKTAMGLETKGNRVWVLAHPHGKFYEHSEGKIRLIKKKLGMDYNPMMINYLVRFIKQSKIQLVVTNIEKEVVIGGIAARVCKIPNIRRVGREDDFNQKIKVKYHHKWFVDSCLVPCDYVRDKSIERAPWLESSQFTTIYNGRNPVPINKETIRKIKAKWGFNENELIIGVTSQLSSQKRIDILLEAFGRIAKNYNGVSLVVAGEGPERAKLEQQVAAAGIDDKIRFVGFVNEPEVLATAYDIAVSPSSFEGFPNTVVEYFAAGCAVVTTSAGGVCEIANHGVNALVIPINDASVMAAAIALLIDQPGFRKELGRNASEAIRCGFSEDLMIERLNTFYHSAIKGTFRVKARP
jgi:glycosyltransferase involved in cell wall biosynthesis